ncbi:MAG: hypothetical protein ABI395_00850 [Sphingobium sp.]
MAKVRGYIAGAGAAFAVVTFALSPAFGAASELLRLRSANPVSLNQLGSISSFTPSTQDDRLAAAYARAIINRNGKSFRFTPTSGSMSGRRSITVLVRAGGGDLGTLDHSSASVGLAPLAFNLDASRGWRKFAMADNVGRKPLDPVVVELPALAKGFTLDRGEKSGLSANVMLDAHREAGTAPQTLAGERKLSVDVASSYSLTRNLNVTAGVRYAGPDSRLVPMTDQRRDNQAVYVGTMFKF